MLRNRSRNMKQNKTTWFKKESSKTSKNKLFCKFFLRREKKRKRKHKGTLLSLEDQQTRNIFSPKKWTVQKEQFKKTLLFCEEGRVCKRRIFLKGRKRCSNQTEFSKKKRDT